MTNKRGNDGLSHLMASSWTRRKSKHQCGSVTGSSQPPCNHSQPSPWLPSYVHFITSHLKRAGPSHSSPFSPVVCARTVIWLPRFVLSAVTRRRRRPGRDGRRTPWRRGWGRGWRDTSRWDTSSTTTNLGQRKGKGRVRVTFQDFGFSFC